MDVERDPNDPTHYLDRYAKKTVAEEERILARRDNKDLIPKNLPFAPSDPTE